MASPPPKPPYPSSFGGSPPNAGGTPRPGTRPPAAPVPVDSPGKTKDFFSSAPKLELPKGGGAIRGIGEKFQANPVSGTASITVPIALSPGRNGFGPSLSLSYDSGAGNGPFGLGWSLGIPHIRRKTDKGLPRYRDATDGDVFVLSDAEDLTPYLEYSGGTWVEPTLVNATDGVSTWSRRRYRPRVEAGFARIERWTETTTKQVHWRTWTRENVRRIYGEDPTARLADPDHATRIFCWYLEEERDERGNLVRYEYQAEDAAASRTGMPANQAEAMRKVAGNDGTYTYLKRILYGNVSPGTDADGWLFEVVFDYGEHTEGWCDDPSTWVEPPTSAPGNEPTAATTWSVRDDIFSSFKSGFDVRCYRLCRRVLMFHRFDDPLATTTDPLLVRTTELFHDENAVATTLTSVVHRGWRYDTTATAWSTAAMPPVAFGYTESVIDETIQFMEGLDDLPNGLDMSQWQWVDLDGEGLSGLLTEQGAGWFYKRNLGAGELGATRRIENRPSLASLGGGGTSRMLDVDGDGRFEVVSLRPGLSGSFGRDAAGNWQGFRPFRTIPTVDWSSPDVRLLDLDGDGLADVMVTENDCITWYPSDGVNGWTASERVRVPFDETQGPRPIFSTERETIFLADMTGDGLVDIVRVRNRNIAYWPNRGYGRFGAKVQMMGAPWFDAPDRFDPKRVRLVDIDGTGPADLVYLGPTHVRIWQNQSGNTWSTTETTLKQLPGVENSAVISVADLLGDGTACLTWASPLMRDAYAPLRYIHLMADGKPYLLKTITNNLGRVTTLTYAPSTEDMVRDREAGTPWATRLPFPVQVLRSVEVRDDITGWRNTTTYAYHHGYYDGDEREFRGFGKVEQWDTEALGTFESSARGTDAELDLDPVRTVSWFHTGAWRQQGTLESAYSAEYWSGDTSLTATSTPTACATADAPGTSWAAMSAGEKKEATRALKGKLLRQEVYAEDGVSDDPFVVTASTWTAVRIQAKGSGRHASFFVVPAESMARHYERDASDPRALHTLTLEYDGYGNVTQQATVSYPRRSTASPTPEQDVLTVVVEAHQFVAVTDVMDAGSPSPVNVDALHWHVGIAWENQKWAVTHDDWQSYTGGTGDPTDLEPLDLPAIATVLADATELAFEGTPSTGLQKRCIGLDRVTFWNNTLTAALADGVLESRALPNQKAQRVMTGGLVSAVYGTRVTTGEFEGAGYVDRDSDGHWWGVSGTQVLDAGTFYQPTSFTDPFGNTSTVTWDTWGLFPLSVEDALGNTVVVEMDRVALQPAVVTDPNGNRTLAAYDELGRLTAVAVQGKVGEGLGDTLADPTVSYTYELDRWWDPGLGVDPSPARVLVASRTEHTGSDFLYRYTYSDGGGNVVQEKVSAEDGEVPGTSGTVSPRWVGTGRTVLNNKGLAVKQYEPFFSATAEYEFEDEVVATGVSSTIRYDALGRVTRVDLPNGTFRSVAFTPWQQTYADENDNVLDSDWYGERSGSGSAASAEEQEAAAAAAAHANTPSTVLLDSLGRPYETQERLTETGDPIRTVVTLDLSGNPVEVWDHKGLHASTPYVLQAQAFDLLGRPLHTVSSDAGTTDALLDVAGQPIALFKSGDLAIAYAYDALRRKTTTTVLEGTSGAELADILASGTVREVMEYGEAAPGTPADDNLLGKPWRAWDPAGRVESASYDFKGNLLASERRFWDRVTAGTDQVTWASSPSATNLESTGYTVAQEYDALNRVTTQTAPDTTVTTNTYNAAGLLETVAVGATTYVSAISYNARGQRETIDYGNGVTVAHTYDADTFRLKSLRAVRTSDSAVLQELTFWYDPVGNVTRVNNTGDTGGILYFANIAVTANRTFTYDALYRLTTATGREKTSLGYLQGGDEPAYGSLPDVNTAVQAYTQTYSYDAVGNLTEMDHVVAGTATTFNWTRAHTYADASNRLDATEITTASGTVTEAFAHDERGSIVYLPGLKFSSSSSLVPNIETDFRDQIVKVHLATSGHYAAYWQDGDGQRVRKLVVKGGTIEERRYVGPYEVWSSNTTTSGDPSERTTLHVMDGTGRIAMRETLTKKGGSAVTPEVTVRYQLGDHLGTACVELDGGGNLLSYEEYHPYGTTAWQAPELTTVSLKRYKYTGMERDEETGLQRHGVRYYATWLGRWVSADPIGLGDGGNRYQYCASRPIALADQDGLAPNLEGRGLVRPGILAFNPDPLQRTSDSVTGVGRGIIVQWTYTNMIDEEVPRSAVLVAPEESRRQPLAAVVGDKRLDPKAFGTGTVSDPRRYYVSWSWIKQFGTPNEQLRGCAPAVERAASKMGYRSGNKSESVFYSETRGVTPPVVDESVAPASLPPAAAARLLDAIDTSLYHGDPFFAYADYRRSHSSTALGEVYDHAIYIIGRDYDADGKVFYWAMNNASAESESTILQRLYVTDAGMLTHFGDKDVADPTEGDYSVINGREMTPRNPRWPVE